MRWCFAQLVNGEIPAVKPPQALYQQANAVNKGLIERLLPKSERVEKLGPDIDFQAILELPGDPLAGREWYLESPVATCRNCHRYSGQGQMIGPDIDRIAKDRSAAELLSSILEPSQKIAPEYAALTVLTEDDRLISGLVLHRDESLLRLRTVDGQTVTIPRDEIRQQRQPQKSLMPDGLAAELTAQELANLLAFLREQR